MYKYTFEQEVANGITHGIGFLLTIIGIPVLINLAVNNVSGIGIMAVVIYSISLLMVYLTSTLYHAFQYEPLKMVFKTLDHISIYFLIAGTYTPFLLIALNDWTGWTMAIVLWSIVVFGIFYKLFYIGKNENLSLAIYIGMGWLVVLIIKPVWAALPTAALAWLGVGGAAYMIGVIFYVSEKIYYGHAIWHVFVLGGSIAHYIAVIYCLTMG